MYVPALYMHVPALYMHVPALYMHVPALHMHVSALYIAGTCMYLHCTGCFTKGYYLFNLLAFDEPRRFCSSVYLTHRWCYVVRTFDD